MNAQQTDDGGLPEVTDETLDRIEHRVFEAIAEERVERPSRARRRRRVWQGVGVAAAVVAVAAVISPAVLQGLGSGGMSTAESADSAVESAPDARSAQDADEQALLDAGGDTATSGSAPTSAESGAAAENGAATPREVIRSGSASIVVDDAAEAADAIVQLATEHEGWVEQLSIGADRSYDGALESGGAVWVPDDGGYVTVRVPAESLDEVMRELNDVGEVASTRVGTDDVTSQAVDLRARIDATRASVDRLTELLAQAGDVGDLVNVETTLSQRQAELESLEQQLESLEGQVAMSTLSVSLLTEAPAVEPDPAGFGDGLSAGWNGLLATANGIVVALGFLLPWIVAIGIAALVVWGVVRAVRRRRKTAE
ncbi:DUF4349 domain-containing protein [Microbacterium marinilacus]|uniref:DUF4349 domain-containing protein n=1 Tax=Microbacterium marinilacus TaxID=415209 RepID=A0ABP7B4E3_9MICO|nr:DUF4349 domain-containing protein [Microbacterium marinilacus]MBY0687897.1 DUF4349 domain-containing protein [Microbacterium marinilacus]